MAKYRPRFFLADLIVMIAFSGLALAFMRAVGMPAIVIAVTLIITLSVCALKLYRLRCEASTCDKCGRQFHPPRQKPTAVFCPECGQPQISRIQPRYTLAIAFWIVLALLSLAVVLACLLPIEPPRVRISFLSWAALPVGMMVLAVLFCILAVTRMLADSTELKPVPCEKCGYIIPSKSATGPLICHRCRLEPPPEKQSRRQQVLGFAIIFAALLIVGLLAGFMVSVFAGSHSGRTYWIAALLVVVGTVVGLPVAIFVALVARILVRFRRLRSEPFILAMRRKAASDDGRVMRYAQATLWYSGPTNPMPLLMEQMEATRTRLESLLDRAMVGQLSLRIVCFEKRSAFLAFLQPFIAHLSTWSKTLDGIYINSPYRILAICTEDVPERVHYPDKTIRTLFCHYFMLESTTANPPAPWLQRGISRTLVGDPDDRVRLNREMLASLSKGTALAAELFHHNDKELAKLLKGWSDYRNFERYEQFAAQSWSVFDYLAGAPRSGGKAGSIPGISERQTIESAAGGRVQASLRVRF